MKKVSHRGPTHTGATIPNLFFSSSARNLYTPGTEHNEGANDLFRSYSFATIVKSTRFYCCDIWLGFEKTRIKKKILGNPLVKRLYDYQETDRKIILRLMLGK
jgi:hypothetical protein